MMHKNDFSSLITCCWVYKDVSVHCLRYVYAVAGRGGGSISNAMSHDCLDRRTEGSKNDSIL
jgi:hypothetical protein